MRCLYQNGFPWTTRERARHDRSVRSPDLGEVDPVSVEGIAVDDTAPRRLRGRRPVKFGVALGRLNPAFHLDVTVWKGSLECNKMVSLALKAGLVALEITHGE